MIDRVPDKSIHLDKLVWICGRALDETRNLPEVEKWDESEET